MKINTVNIQNDGYINCRSDFYFSCDVLTDGSSYAFSSGVNMLVGEIDSGVWGVSYLLSMYRYRHRKDFTVFKEPVATIDGRVINLKELSEYSCYMDLSYPLFEGHISVRKLVTKALKYSKLNYSCEDIKNMFDLDSYRFEKPLKTVGNERFRAMAAIGFAYGKKIFCFPWLSNRRFEYFYTKSLKWILEKLTELNKIVIMPVGTLSQPS